jgi:hypothetical protein
MLEVCREKLDVELESVQQHVQLVQADMRSFDLGRTFRLATIPFRPFQHLITVDDQLRCLRSIHRHLAEGGRLILDLFNPSLPSLVRDDIGQETGDEPEFEAPDGRRVVRRSRIVSRDLANQVNFVELIYYVRHPDGQAERLVHAFPMRYLFRYEAEHLLSAAASKSSKSIPITAQPVRHEVSRDLMLVAEKQVGIGGVSGFTRGSSEIFLQEGGVSLSIVSWRTTWHNPDETVCKQYRSHSPLPLISTARAARIRTHQIGRKLKT